MANTYEKYLKLNVDCSCIGLGRGKSESSYFCTPKGAKVIGWADTDGIHYCFVDGFDEMVFAVSPMNTPGYYVHPVARDFMDFLRLLLACGNVSALEQVYCWDKVQFEAFLQDNPLTAEQQAVLDTIREQLSLVPMEQPFAYIKELQAGFNYSRIKYTDDYDKGTPVQLELPPWKVYFNGNFWGHHGQEEAGKEITLHKQLAWDDEEWYIPAIYSCRKGLVMDFCLQVPAESIRSFMERWNLSIENDGTGFTDEQHMQIDIENPLATNINPKTVLNGTLLSESHSCCITWNPCFPEVNSFEARSVLQHYGLDPAYGWAIWRSAFIWTKERQPQIKTLSITLKEKPAAVPGPHFHVSAHGEHIEFTHPATSTQHTLTVKEYEQQEMSHEYFDRQNQDFPTYCTVMGYTLLPDLPDGAITITDCLRSDLPRQKSTDLNEPQAFNCIFTTIIGSADGPTGIISGGRGQAKIHTACSARHFSPVDDVEWRIVFYLKRREDVTVKLI